MGGGGDVGGKGVGEGGGVRKMESVRRRMVKRGDGFEVPLRLVTQLYTGDTTLPRPNKQMR